MKAYLDEIGEPFDSEAFDYSLHKKRSKTLGLYIYSDKLKQASVKPMNDSKQSNMQLSQQSINHLANLGALPTLPSAVATGSSITPIETEIHIGSLKVKVLDNLFRCPQDNCEKTFRNQNHLQIHIKHYHRVIAK
jgi:PHD finger protein 20